MSDNRPAEFDRELLATMKKMRRFAHRFAHTEEDREDLVQDTMQLAMHRWASHRAEYDMYGWLCFIMRARAWEIRHRSYRIPTQELDTNYQGSVEPCQEHGADVSKVSSALNALADNHRDVLVRTAGGERQFEIAAEKGVSIQAVHDLLKRARTRLYRAMEAVGEAA